MITSIQCPHCKHKMRMRFGLIVKAHVRYEWNPDYIWNLPGSIKYLNASWYYNRGQELSWWKLFQKRKALLGFWCRHCEKTLPEEMTPEILEFLKLNGMLNKLKKS